MQKVLGLVILLSIQSAMASPLQIEAITLNHRSAQEIAEIVKPLLTNTGTVQTYNNDLILKDTPEQINALLELIRKLDVQASRLMVSISHGSDKPSQAFSVDEQGKVHYGRHSNAQPSTKSRYYQTSRETNRSIHHLSMTSGEKAYLQTGKSIPIVVYEDGNADDYNQRLRQNENEVTQKTGLNATVPANANTQIKAPSNANPFVTTNLILSVPPVTNALVNAPAGFGNISIGLDREEKTKTSNTALDTNAQRRGYARQTIQKELKSGVYIQPTLMRDKVSLTVQTVNERAHRDSKQSAARNKPSYATQTMETTLVVPLGQWTYLGGNQKETEINNQWDYSTRERALDRSQIWVRIDLVE